MGGFLVVYVLRTILPAFEVAHGDRQTQQTPFFCNPREKIFHFVLFYIFSLLDMTNYYNYRNRHNQKKRKRISEIPFNPYINDHNEIRLIEKYGFLSEIDEIEPYENFIYPFKRPAFLKEMRKVQKFFSGIQFKIDRHSDRLFSVNR